MIGSHNTMTYLKPKSWWMRPLIWMGRCQDKTYQEQYKSGVKAFDVRVFWDDEGELEFRHGMFAFSGEGFSDFLKFCQQKDIIVRLLFEERKFPAYLRKRSEKLALFERFINLCEWVEETYPYLKLTCCKNTETGQVLYEPKTKELKQYHFYSSQTSLWEKFPRFDDLWPRLYSMIRNKKHLRTTQILDSNSITWLDFV